MDPFGPDNILSETFKNYLETSDFVEGYSCYYERQYFIITLNSEVDMLTFINNSNWNLSKFTILKSPKSTFDETSMLDQ